ncbi:MAG: hypothetical protein ACI35O_10085 [Bacillaceae bacterium]
MFYRGDEKDGGKRICRWHKPTKYKAIDYKRKYYKRYEEKNIEDVFVSIEENMDDKLIMNVFDNNREEVAMKLEQLIK